MYPSEYGMKSPIILTKFKALFVLCMCFTSFLSACEPIEETLDEDRIEQGDVDASDVDNYRYLDDDQTQGIPDKRHDGSVHFHPNFSHLRPLKAFMQSMMLHQGLTPVEIEDIKHFNLSVDDLVDLMEQAEEIFRNSGQVSYRAIAVAQKDIEMSMNEITELYLEMDGKIKQFAEGTLPNAEKIALYDDLQDFSRVIKRNAMMNLTFSKDLTDTNDILQTLNKLEAFEQQLPVKDELGNLVFNGAELDELLVQASKIKDETVTILKRFSTDIEDGFTTAAKAIEKKYQSIVRLAEDSQAKGLIDPKFLDELLEFKGQVNGNLSSIRQCGFIGGEQKLLDEVQGFHQILNEFDREMFALNKLDMQPLYSTEEFFQLAKRNQLLQDTESLTEMVERILKNPDRFEVLLKRITGKTFPAETSAAVINEALKKSLYVAADHADDLLYHTFSSISYSNASAGIDLRPLLPGEIPFENNFAVRIAKNFGQNNDGTYNYLVQVVTRVEQSDTLVDQYVFHSTEDAFDLTNELALKRVKSRINVTKFNPDISNPEFFVDLKKALQQIKGKNSQAAVEALDLFIEHQNLFLADILEKELKQLQRSGEAQGIAAIAEYLEHYKQVNYAFIKQGQTLQTEINTLLKNQQLNDFYKRYTLLDDISMRETLVDELREADRALYDDFIRLKYAQIDQRTLPDFDHLMPKDVRLANLEGTHIFDVNHIRLPVDDLEKYQRYLERISQMLQDYPELSSEFEDFNRIYERLQRLLKQNSLSANELLGEYEMLDSLMERVFQRNILPNQVEFARQFRVEMGLFESQVSAIAQNNANTIVDEIVDGIARSGDKITDGIQKAIKGLAADFAFEAVASAYSIYTLDSSYYARDYADRNNLAAQSTSMLAESAASLVASAGMYAAQSAGLLAAGFWPIAAPVAIFMTAGVATSVLLDQRYQKMKKAQKTQLLFHQLYHKYTVDYKNQRDLYTINGLTGSNVLSFVKDADIIIEGIDLSQEQLAVDKTGALELEQADRKGNGTGTLFNLLNFWSADTFYPQVTLGNDSAETAANDSTYPTEQIDALILPTQAKFSKGWHRHVITTKANGVFSKNFQLGASLALKLEKSLFADFKPWFFMNENRHIDEILHDQVTYRPTDIQVKLPKRSIDLIFPQGGWFQDHLNVLSYTLINPIAHQGYYSFISHYFEALNEKSIKPTQLKLTLKEGHPDLIWDFTLHGLDLNDAEISYSQNGLRIQTLQRTLLIDTQNFEGHLWINGLKDSRMSYIYAKVQNQQLVKMQPTKQTVENYQQRKTQHLQQIRVRSEKNKLAANVQAITQAATTYTKKTFYISNVTWEKATAEIYYIDGTFDTVHIEPEDTLQVHFNRDLQQLDFIKFYTTKSVRYTYNPSRIVDHSTLLDHLSEGSKILCFSLNQGTMSRDFRATAELCDSTTARYYIGNEPLDQTLPIHERRVYKIDHMAPDDPKKTATYYKISIDNNMGLSANISIRYDYLGTDYRLSLEEELKDYQEITSTHRPSTTAESRATFYIPEGAMITSIKATYPKKDRLFNLFDTFEKTPLNQPMNADLYYDLKQGKGRVIMTLLDGHVHETTAEERAQFYRDQFSLQERFWWANM